MSLIYQFCGSDITDGQIFMAGTGKNVPENATFNKKNDTLNNIFSKIVKGSYS